MKKLAKILSLTMALLVSMLVFTACVPSDIESAREKMQEKGYTVVDYADYEADNDDGILGGIWATDINSVLNSSDDQGIIALYFESSQKAKEYAESWQDDKYDDVSYSGKWAFAGTEQAIKDFKA